MLHDRVGISPDLILDPGAALIVSLMDGHNDLRDIQVALMRRGGLGLVSMVELKDFIRKLDENLLLDNERYRSHREEIARQFHQQELRVAAHAGKAYPADPQKLRHYLDRNFQAVEATTGQSAEQGTQGLPAGLVLPHIDLERGGRCYAWGYQALGASVKQVDLFVILGTCHLPMELPFALTRKVFETPLGQVSCAGELAEQLCQIAGMDFLKDELVHRAEHTIEVQLIFLQHLAGRGPYPFRILPILCGGFHEIMEKRILPLDHPPMARAMEALRRILAEFVGTVCAIASADLAHLGPQFGDSRPIEMSELGRIMREDMALLEWVLKGNTDGFYQQIMAEGDRRRICGLPPIYAWLHLMEGKSVRLLNYDQAYHPQCTVTFASLGAW